HLVVAEPSSTFVAFVVVHLVVFLGDHPASAVVVLARTPAGSPHIDTVQPRSSAGCNIVEGVALVASGLPLASSAGFQTGIVELCASGNDPGAIVGSGSDGGTALVTL
ncbi:hypothetical protein Tco_1155987, partial [Tanacetum coccineum]